MEAAAVYHTRRQRSPALPREWNKWPDWKKVLYLLRDANRYGDGRVPIGVFYDMYLGTYRSRLADLRRMGFNIPRTQNYDDIGWAVRLIEEPQGRLEL